MSLSRLPYFIGTTLLAVISGCGSPDATVDGDSEPVTASGSLTLTGTAVTELPGKIASFTPDKGAEIKNPGSYMLKFDDTMRAIDLLYAELSQNGKLIYQLNWSQITVDSGGIGTGYNWEAKSEGVQIAGISVDKPNRKITFSQVSLSGLGTDSTLVLDGVLYVQP